MVLLVLLDLRVQRGPRDRQVQTEHPALPVQWDLQVLPGPPVRCRWRSGHSGTRGHGATGSNRSCRCRWCTGIQRCRCSDRWHDRSDPREDRRHGLQHPMGDPASGGASDWGDLGGTITDQTDLIAYLAATYLALGGGALTGRVDFKAGNSTSASFRIPGGTAPSSPAHGDVYASGGTNLVIYLASVVVLHELHQQGRDLHREEDVPALGGRRGTDQPWRQHRRCSVIACGW